VSTRDRFDDEVAAFVLRYSRGAQLGDYAEGLAALLRRIATEERAAGREAALEEALEQFERERQHHNATDAQLHRAVVLVRALKSEE